MSITEEPNLAPAEAARASELTAEERRLEEARRRAVHWKRWGPYLSERAWGTVREDYSPAGEAWQYLTYDDARSKAYRWNEDGLGGISDRHGLVCFAVALWNGRDSILKERLFGLAGPEGNHGEDVKECYYYLDSTPTHSYMKFLYKYPQEPFPYSALVEENRRRSKHEPEYELTDTGVFDGDRYFDLVVEYAKADAEDILVRITAVNRGPSVAKLVLLPTIWFRNTWAWAAEARRPRLRQVDAGLIEVAHERYGTRWLACGRPLELLFTENETNTRRLYGVEDGPRLTKDGFHEFIVGGHGEAVSFEGEGTKAAAHYARFLEPGEVWTVKLRFSDTRPAAGALDAEFDVIFEERIREADEFYARVIPLELPVDGQRVMRQAFAGLMWSKQYYHYVVRDWISGDPAQPSPPDERRRGRNSDWPHLFNADVISMPDAWEYPWYAAWDLAFHCIPIALVDSDFAKEQLVLMLREWYMHPNGQIPAYEWAFGDVNPPVHAWAALRVYKIEKRRRGVGDRKFLERVFQKLLLNFTWWVNRKDAEGRNLFQGGFLGLDNIGVFDRSRPLPTGGHLEQSDGTSWMAMYALNLLAIALELAEENEAYEDVASKFWEHFLYIANAMNHRGDEGIGLWDEEDGFFYDVLHRDGHPPFPLKVRSMVGLIPLFAVQTLEPERLAQLPGFRRRLEWFVENRADLTANVACMRSPGRGERRLLSIVDEAKLRRVLAIMLDEREFLSPFGVRALSKVHAEAPYTLEVGGERHTVAYEPAESTSGLFGGNSNWRGPIWLPVNFLLVESLQRFHHYFGDEMKVECPTGSGRYATLWEVAAELSRRLARPFLLDGQGRRPINNGSKVYDDEHWRDLVLFYEYLNGDTGAGVGASHQTGWTALVAKLIQQNGVDMEERTR